MNWRQDWKPLSWLSGVFLLLYFLPLGHARFDRSLFEALELARWYAREHVLLCLVPAFFIAGAIAVFINRGAVMKYLGPTADRAVAYGVAAVSGTVLAVCSCTVLPLFAGIYRMGAGLGPATAFLYAGPAINVLAVILTARVIGLPLGLARAVGAVLFSVVIGLLMQFIFRADGHEDAAPMAAMPTEEPTRPLWQTAVHFLVMIAILVFGTWSGESVSGFYQAVHGIKWPLVGLAATALGLVLVFWYGFNARRVLGLAAAVAVLGFMPDVSPLVAYVTGALGLAVITNFERDENREWLAQTWDFARQIMPLLFAGVLISGLLLGRPGEEGLIPANWVASLVGGNSLGANVVASVAGAFMYFATLTEVPILQGLLGAGMGQGPALALLLAGPAVSLPSILVLRSIMGWRRTGVFIVLVVIMASLSGLIFGTVYG